MRIGLSQQKITPKNACQMAGFDRRSLPSEGTAEELLVSVVALERSGRRYFLCTYDLLGTDIDFVEAVAGRLADEFGVDPLAVIVSATHTHAGPGTHFFGRNGFDADYVSYVLEQTVKAASRAQEDMCEAVTETAAASVTGVGTPRNLGAVGTDFAMPMRLLRFRTERGQLLLCRFACHPTVLDEKNRSFSRDLVGAAARRIRSSDAVVLFNGACGDLSTRYTRTESSCSEAERLGGILAEAADAAVYQKLQEPLTVACAVRTIQLARIGELDRERRAELLNEITCRIRACTDAKELRELDSRLAVLERPPRPAEPPHRIRISCLRIGSIAWVFLPFEINHGDGQELEQRLHRASGLDVTLCCYSGGYEGYLPSGKPLTADSSYEDFASRYAMEAREQIWESTERCLLETIA